MPISEANHALLVHVPKTSGMTLVHVVFQDAERPLGQWGHLTVLEEFQHLKQVPVAYFEFAFVQNPWDRLVSAYHHIQEKRADHRPLIAPFAACAQFLRVFGNDPRRVESVVHFRAQSDFFSDSEGQTPLDCIGHFNHYQQGVDYVSHRLGLPLGGVGKRNHSRHAYFQGYYDDPPIQAVGNYYRRDVKLFGYTL